MNLFSLWVLRIILAVLVCLVIIHIPSLFMNFLMNKWSPELRKEMDSLFEGYKTQMEKKRAGVKQDPLIEQAVLTGYGGLLKHLRGKLKT